MKRYVLCLLLAGCSTGVPAGTAPPPPHHADRPTIGAVPQATNQVPLDSPRPEVEPVPDFPVRSGPVVRFLPPTPQSDARWRGEVVDDPLDHPEMPG